MIPCKDCLVLAVCKSRIEIKCDLLYKWWFRPEAIHDFDKDSKEVRKYIDIPFRKFQVEKG